MVTLLDELIERFRPNGETARSCACSDQDCKLFGCRVSRDEAYDRLVQSDPILRYFRDHTEAERFVREKHRLGAAGKESGELRIIPTKNSAKR